MPLTDTGTRHSMTINAVAGRAAVTQVRAKEFDFDQFLIDTQEKVRAVL